MSPDDTDDGLFGIDSSGGSEPEAADDGQAAAVLPPGQRRKNDRGQTPEERGSGRLFKALISRVPKPQAKRLVTETYGKTSRNTPNVKAAAAEFGVHPDTVRRWIREGMPKKSPAADKLRSSWENSPKGRKASLSPERRKAISGAGKKGVFSGTLTGYVWVDTYDRRNGDERSFEFTMDEAKAQQINEAVLAGDDERAHEILQSSLNGFGSSVDIDLTDFSWKGLP